MSFCMSFSWNRLFGNFEHQDNGGAQTLAERKATAAALARREKPLRMQIERRRTAIRALEAEIMPFLAQYKNLAANQRTAPTAKRLFKEKIAPLERRLAAEERELKADEALLNLGSRGMTKDNTNDVRGAYLRAAHAHALTFGKASASSVTGDQADEMLDSITEAQLALGNSDNTFATSLHTQLGRLNMEDALDADAAAAVDAAAADEGTEESVLRRLNERFQFQDEPLTPPEPASSSSSTTTQVRPQPSDSATSLPVYRSDMFPPVGTAMPDRTTSSSRSGGSGGGSGRQAVAASTSRGRHVTFDTDD